jgi:hypothetical protein
METSFKHTPGPWKVFYPENIDCGFGIDTESGNESIVVMDTEAGIYSAETREEDLANAKLIAAAPDLLEALQGIERLKTLIEYPREVSECHVGEAMAVSAAMYKVTEAIKKAIQ